MAPATTHATWFSPVRLLALFCAMNLFIYIDRGVIASNGVNGAPDTSEKAGYGIQGDFGLTLFEDGLLPAAFMVGLLVSSPIFAEASKRYNAFRLIGAGLGVWTAAVVGCGLSVGFVSLLLCRMAVGVGEASFVALASPFIDDNAPADKKTRWLATFYLCIPTGYALGYIYGGLVAAAIGWRAAFLIQGGAMVPFVAFCLRAPPIDIRGTHGKQPQQHGNSSSGGAGQEAAHSRSEEGLLPPPHPTQQQQAEQQQQQQQQEEQAHGGGLQAVLAAVTGDLRVLGSHRVYVLAVGGMTMYTAVLGTFAFYGPKAGRDVFGIAPEAADVTFGAITVATGVFGTLAGGVLLDRMGSSLRNALLLCTLGILLGCLCVMVGFLLSPSFVAFSAWLAAGEFAMFMTQAPSNAICMWSVPPGLRPFAMSMSVVAMHVLGDVPAPPLLGALQGALRNWRLSMGLCSSLLLAGAAFYGAGLRVAASAVDYRALLAPEGEGRGEEDDEEGGGGGGGEGARNGGVGVVGAAGALGGAAQAQAQAQAEWDEGGRASPDKPLLPHSHRS